MSDTTETQSAEESVEAQEPKQSEETQEPQEGQEELSVEDLRAALKKARDDAAAQRTRRRERDQAFKDLEARLEGMKSEEDIQELVSQLKTESAERERQLLAENVALDAGLPKTLAARLQGQTREELEADAKALAELVSPSSSAGSSGGAGGLDPKASGGDDFDPVEAAKKYSRRNR